MISVFVNKESDEATLADLVNNYTVKSLEVFGITFNGEIARQNSRLTFATIELDELAIDERDGKVKPKGFHPPNYWKHLIGINRPPDGKVESVVLEFSYLHGRYFLSNPFFVPYEIQEDSSEKLVVKIELMIDIELIRRIAAYGRDVKVLAPASLSEKIKAFFKDALERYP